MLIETSEWRIIDKPDFHSMFNKKNGFQQVWGRTVNDDPTHSPYGPLLFDMEISQSGNCHGCKWCYKENGNGGPTYNMGLSTFQRIMDRMPPTLNQIAFGICKVKTNPDFWAILTSCKNDYDIIPNFTIHPEDVSEDVAINVAMLCGAVAVSYHGHEATVEAVSKFVNAGIAQTNVHFVLSEESFDRAVALIQEGVDDVNAIVFLAYKNKGRNVGQFHSIKDPKKYKYLIELCQENHIGMGFDSCTYPIFKAAVGDSPMLQFATPCESLRESGYCNVFGQFFPCSFLEGTEDWKVGLDILSCKDFLTDIWNHPKSVEFRNKSIQCNGDRCPCHFDLFGK